MAFGVLLWRLFRWVQNESSFYSYQHFHQAKLGRTIVSVASYESKSSICLQVRCRALSFESPHGSVCAVHVLFMLFHSTSFCLWREVDHVHGVLFRKRFLSRRKSSCSLGVKQGLHNNIRNNSYYLSPTTKLPLYHLTHHYATIFQRAETTTTTTTTRQSFRLIVIDPSLVALL